MAADAPPAPRRAASTHGASVRATAAEAVLVAADPPRQSALALWHPLAVPEPIDGRGARPEPGGGRMAAARSTDGSTAIVTLRMALPHPGGSGTAPPVRAQSRRARLVPMREAIEWLAAFTPADDTTASMAAWVTAARLGLDLIARGRLLPGRTEGGWDTWRVGPLDPEDAERLAALVATFPTAAHALAIPKTRPVRIATAASAIHDLWDAMADTLVRTGAAELVATPPAAPAPARTRRATTAARGPVGAASPPAAGPTAVPFAAAAPVAVDALDDWLQVIGRGLTSDGARPILRIDLPPAERALIDAAAQPGPDGEHEAGSPPAEAPTTVTEDSFRLRGTLQLRSAADPSLVVDAADLWSAPDTVLARLGEQAETDLLLGLRRGALVWPPLERALQDARPSGLEIDDDEALMLLGTAGTDLAAAGFEVLWPAELTRTEHVELRAVLSTPTPDAVAPSGLDLNAILHFDWRATIAGQTLTAAELHELAEAKRPLVRLRGRWVVADPRLAERLAHRERNVRGGDALAAALAGSVTVDGETVELEVEGPLATLADRLRELDSTDELPEPPGLVAQLRPYQRRGLAWLVAMTDLGLGGCLADDMGLGKTIQLIALHLHRHGRASAGAGAGARSGRAGAAVVGPAPAPTLVVCPTSLLGNWERELHRFAPAVPVRRYHGGERHLEGLAPDEVVLVTYGVVRRDRAALAEQHWGLVVADEAQHVKNPLARTARELRAIPADARVALTGTPIENRMSELWAILDWTTPGLLGPLELFRQNVAVPIERHRDAEATARFARLVRPFLLRRRKIDPGIAPELPAKTETDQIVSLTPEQITLYEAVVRETMAEIEAAGEGIARRGLVLKLLTALKQITNHPAQYLKQSGPLPGRSGKLAALDELLEAILDAGDSALVFTQYVTMGRLLESHLASRGIPSLFLHGQVTATRREALVERFQAGEVPVFILSLKAGGTGLNLTRASHVIHYDRWWNPAVEDQATDRAHRIGQTRAVQVHRLVSEGTVEDRIAQLLARKRELADSVVGTGEGWIGDLSNEELAELVALTREADA